MSVDVSLIGLRHSATLRVDEGLTVPQVSDHFAGFRDMPPVFATAYLVGFIENTCIEAVLPWLDEGQGTVGTYVDVSHVAATPAGMNLTAEVELIEVDVELAARPDLERGAFRALQEPAEQTRVLMDAD